MKILKSIRVFLLAVFATLLASGAMAGPFDALVAAVDFSEPKTAILGVAAVLVGFVVFVGACFSIISFIKRGR